ncbi:unnamed protein product [Chrysoparadoxa australica]
MAPPRQVQLQRLSFGYERERGKEIKEVDRGVVKIGWDQTLGARLWERRKRSSDPEPEPRALCLPQEERRPGCGPLFDLQPLEGEPLHPLPCVECGECPFQKFRCKRGHTWKAVSGSPVCYFCPICASSATAGLRAGGRPTGAYAKDGLEKLTEAAVLQGGKCLSKTFVGMAGSYEFECKHGHQWSGRASNILQGSWCPACDRKAKSRSRRLTMADMHETASRTQHKQPAI